MLQFEHCFPVLREIHLYSLIKVLNLRSCERCVTSGNCYKCEIATFESLFSWSAVVPRLYYFRNQVKCVRDVKVMHWDEAFR